MITGTGAPKELDRLSPTAMTRVIRFAYIYFHITSPEARSRRPLALTPIGSRRAGLTSGAPAAHDIIAPRKVAVIRPRAIVREAIADRASLRLAPFRRGTFDFSA
jgi:hypothetical protein